VGPGPVELVVRQRAIEAAAAAATAQSVPRLGPGLQHVRLPGRGREGTADEGMPTRSHAMPPTAARPLAVLTHLPQLLEAGADVVAVERRAQLVVLALQGDRTGGRKPGE